MFLCLARACYDSDDLKAAKRYLMRAIHIAPTDYRLRFNAGLTMQASVWTHIWEASQMELRWIPGVAMPFSE